MWTNIATLDVLWKPLDGFTLSYHTDPEMMKIQESVLLFITSRKWERLHWGDEEKPLLWCELSRCGHLSLFHLASVCSTPLAIQNVLLTQFCWNHSMCQITNLQDSQRIISLNHISYHPKIVSKVKNSWDYNHQVANQLFLPHCILPGGLNQVFPSKCSTGNS